MAELMFLSALRKKLAVGAARIKTTVDLACELNPTFALETNVLGEHADKLVFIIKLVLSLAPRDVTDLSERNKNVKTSKTKRTKRVKRAKRAKKAKRARRLSLRVNEPERKRKPLEGDKTIVPDQPKPKRRKSRPQGSQSS